MRRKSVTDACQVPGYGGAGEPALEPAVGFRTLNSRMTRSRQRTSFACVTALVSALFGAPPFAHGQSLQHFAAMRAMPAPSPAPGPAQPNKLPPRAPFTAAEDDTAIVPISTAAEEIFGGTSRDAVSSIIVQARSSDDLTAAYEIVRAAGH